MPFISGLSTVNTVAANTIMLQAFMARAKKQVHPRLSRPFKSVRLVEPIAIPGAVPPLSLFQGSMKSKNLQSWKVQSPNHLWKNFMDIQQSQFEGDQTGFTRHLGQYAGVELANTWDRIAATRFLKGTTATTTVFDVDGQTYNLTMDGLAQFSAAHNTWSGGVQSNIISGNLPATAALFAANDMKTNANKMIQDIQAVINTAMTVKTNQGQPIYPNLDPAEQIQVLVPPLLAPCANLAFGKVGQPIQLVDSTTVVSNQYVNEVITWGLLAGFVEPETDALVSPANATDYYVAIKQDYVSPLYVHPFAPLPGDKMFPPDYNAGAVIDGIMNALESAGQANAISEAEVATFAGARIDTNIGAIGSNAQRDVVEKEQFFVSSRLRGNVLWGPWFTVYKVKPYGGS
jgi:hypothetical protein